MLRDKIVLGVSNRKLQERLLQESNLDYDKAVELCKAAVLLEQQTTAIQSKEESNIHQIQQSVQKFKFSKQRGNFQNRNVNMSNTCSKCNKRHNYRECPAYGKLCNNCNDRNHFAVCCKNKKIKSLAINQHRDSKQDSYSSYSNNLDLYINEVNKLNLSVENQWYENIKIENILIKFKLDTGSEVNIIPQHIFHKILPSRSLYKTPITLYAFGGQKIRPLGIIKLAVVFRNNISEEEFFIVNNSTTPILGLRSCYKLNIIKRIETINVEISSNVNEFTKQNKDIFQGIGKFPQKYKIELIPEAIPSIKGPRRVPLKLRDTLYSTLQDLVEKNIISEVTEARDWVHPLVIVQKKNLSLRLCIDPRNLNKYIKPQQFLIPKIEEITENISHAKYFTVLDLKDGFWQIELEDESKKLCTFSTPFGNFQFNRLPFGVKTAPEIFQNYNSTNFSDLSGVTVYINDILITGKSLEEHDANLKKVIIRARELNIKFNINKIQYRCEEVSFVGHVLSNSGLKPDTNRIEAITKLTNPKNKTEVQQFLGVVNYLRSFVNNMADLTAPLRELLKKNKLFLWSAEHTLCMENIKKALAEAPVLQPFDQHKEITLQCDASQYGLGCCLLQNGKPVAYASRSLTEVESRYAQIEKELLSIIFACKKFHYYIYGRSITIHNDHKPLFALLDKEIHKISSAKLQRMRLKLLNYDIKMYHIPGKHLIIADYLSRNFLKDTVDYSEEKLNELIFSINVSDEKIKLFQTETEKDKSLKEIMKLYRNGWPNDKTKVKEEVRFYHKMRSDIYVEDDLVFYENRLVVPITLRKDMLNKLHEVHFGISKTKARAREMLYWPGINEDIENLVGNCETCQKYQARNRPEPLIPHNIPMVPFNKVGCDIFHYAAKDYLILVDYFSKWIEFRQLRNKSASEIINAWMDIFSTFGIPKTVIADNVPFSSFECRKFAKEWNLEIITSSPLYPKSNGQVERSVKTIKDILRKNKTKPELYIALLELRNSNSKDLDKSPAQLMMNRRLRTKLPITEELLKPSLNENMENKFEQKIRKYKEQHDKKARCRNDFQKGEDIYLQKGNQWVNGKNQC